MDLVARAAERLEQDLPNGAQFVLLDGGLNDSWSVVLLNVPAKLLVDTDDALSLLRNLRDHWLSVGMHSPALSSTQLLLATARRQLGDDHLITLSEVAKMGLVFLQSRRGEDGILLLQTAWYSLNEQLEHADPMRITIAGALGNALAEQGSWDQAQDFLHHALAVQRQHNAVEGWPLASQLALAYDALEKRREAIPLHKEAWLGAKTLLGDGHPRTLTEACVLGQALLNEDRASEAVFALQQAVEWSQKGGHGELQAQARFLLGQANLEFGQNEVATRLIEWSVRWSRDAGDAHMPHEKLPERLTLLASIELERGRQESAEGILREALEAERRLYGEDSVQVALRYAGLGALALKTQRIDEAMGWLEVGISLLRSTVGDNDPRTRNAVIVQVDLILHLAESAAKRRDRAQFLDWLVRAEAVAVPVLGADDTRVIQIRQSMSR